MSHQNLDYTGRIRQQGYRVTPQRQMILDMICAAGGHTSVEEIYERLHKQAPSVNLATVYRTVDFFRHLGLVVVADINGRTVYEIAGETPHHHLICRSCGSVQNMPHYRWWQMAAQLHQEYGFQAEMDHLAITGLCARCLAKSEN